MDFVRSLFIYIFAIIHYLLLSCIYTLLCQCVYTCTFYINFQGQGGPDCDFYPAATLDGHITLESCLIPGSHVGVLPSGQLTAPAQTSKQTDASHFKIIYIVSFDINYTEPFSAHGVRGRRPFFFLNDLVNQLDGNCQRGIKLRQQIPHIVHVCVGIGLQMSISHTCILCIFSSAGCQEIESTMNALYFFKLESCSYKYMQLQQTCC